ncbi:MAG: hypothetical protein QNJ70_21075 [Xenococcaceae cyanobacterium MO_207.B15]|nr:hypothetical protein [Xenococcaceae cyanobacterium MO_207.B15]MDJ0744691.1 hypothetical protein [Xenococcaceae cyanobacterium MO_167.B27]
MNITLLRNSWHNLLQEFQAYSQLEEAIFADLVKAYSHPARHYHNLEHIKQILNLIETVREISDRFAILQFSAWFHDYVYHPQAKNNEVKSAVYAEKNLKNLKISPDIIQLVKQIILSTQKHEPLTDNIDNLIFLDTDLSILGTSLDKYFKYVQAIRQEYIWLSDGDYQQGRKQVLTNFLARERIYYTDYFYQQLEVQARTNLKAEIEIYSY